MCRKDSQFQCFTLKPSMPASSNFPLGSTRLRGVTPGCFHSHGHTERAAPEAKPHGTADVSQLLSPQSGSDSTQQPGQPCATAALGLLTLLRTWGPTQKLQQGTRGSRRLLTAELAALTHILRDSRETLVDLKKGWAGHSWALKTNLLSS